MADCICGFGLPPIRVGICHRMIFSCRSSPADVCHLDTASSISMTFVGNYLGFQHNRLSGRTNIESASSIRPIHSVRSHFIIYMTRLDTVTTSPSQFYRPIHVTIMSLTFEVPRHLVCSVSPPQSTCKAVVTNAVGLRQAIIRMFT